MKRCLLAVIAILLSTAVSAFAADQVITTNQITVGWDPVTTLSDTTALPADHTIEYEVFSEDVNTLEVSSVGQVASLQSLITFTNEGRYYVGVEALRYDSGHVLLSKSGIAWSGNPQSVSGGQTFIVQYFIAPALPVLNSQVALVVTQ